MSFFFFLVRPVNLEPCFPNEGQSCKVISVEDGCVVSFANTESQLDDSLGTLNSLFLSLHWAGSFDFKLKKENVIDNGACANAS